MFPGQYITLSEFSEMGDAVSFFVDKEGWIEYGDEYYDISIGGHLDPIPLTDGSEEFTPSEKSETNCLEGEVANESSGRDIGISVENMSIEDNGDYVMCYATLKNNTGETIENVTAHASLMDSNGNIIGRSDMQEMVSVAPGQSITLSSFQDEEGLAYFTISYCAFDYGDDYYSGYLEVVPKAAAR